MTIYPFKEEAFVTKALSEKRISYDYLDVVRKQTLKDFINYINPYISYKADDFLVLLNDDSNEILLKKRFVDFHKVSQFGWYYEKSHRINAQIFASNDSIKIKNLLDLNSTIRIASFDNLRNDAEHRKMLNVLAGALALCYHCFRAEYDSFFSKAVVDKGRWIFSKKDYDPKNDAVILLQIALIHHPQDSTLNRELFPQEKALQVLHDYLSTSLKYFLNRTYSMSEFLNYLRKDFSTNPDYLPITKGLTDLDQLYVQKGLSTTPTNKLVSATKEFLDLAKTDSDRLREFLENNHNYSKTAIFLLGMLHLSDRLEERFAFSNFIPLLVEGLVFYVRDIRFSKDTIEIEFDEQYASNQSNKYQYICSYLSDLQRIRTAISEINKIKATSLKLIDIIEADKSLVSLQVELDNLQSEKARQETNKSLIQKEIEILTNQIHGLEDERTNNRSLIKELLMEKEKLTSDLLRAEAERAKLQADTTDISIPSLSKKSKKQPKQNRQPIKSRKTSPKTSKAKDGELFQGTTEKSDLTIAEVKT